MSKMKNFNAFGVHWKIGLLREGVGVHEKNNIKGGGHCLKGGGGSEQFVDLRKDLAKKKGWCFWGEFDTLIHSMSYSYHTEISWDLFFSHKSSKNSEKEASTNLPPWCFMKTLRLTRSRVMALKSEWEIADGNGIWLTHYSYFE